MNLKVVKYEECGCFFKCILANNQLILTEKSLAMSSKNNFARLRTR